MYERELYDNKNICFYNHDFFSFYNSESDLMQFVKSVHVGLHRYLYLLEIINIYTIKWMSYNVCKLYLEVDIKRKLNMYKLSFEMNAFLFR